MRRLSILIGLIMLLWFASDGDPFGAIAAAAPVTPQEACCVSGTGDTPHLACVSGQCVEVNTCGFDDCNACPGCDPIQREQCLGAGWYWTEATCTCTPPSCDPDGTLQAYCFDIGGIWDSFSCTCTPAACNPGPPVLVDYSNTGWSYCIDCDFAEVCTRDTYCYAQYCQDGTLYSYWCEQSGLYCYYAWDPWCIVSLECTGGGGG